MTTLSDENSKLLTRIYQQMRSVYGAQDWWPADSAFEVMVGAVLTQNTAWSNVEKAIANLKQAQCLGAQAIIDAPHEVLAAYLRPSGYFNIKTVRLKQYCTWYLAEGGFDALMALEMADLRARLLSVKGVGPETADDILLYAFGRPVFVIDAYTRRLLQRVGMIAGDEDYETLRGLLERALGLDVALFNEYHALIVWHAKVACKKKPLCGGCCLSSDCAFVFE